MSFIVKREKTEEVVLKNTYIFFRDVSPLQLVLARTQSQEVNTRSDSATAEVFQRLNYFYIDALGKKKLEGIIGIPGKIVTLGTFSLGNIWGFVEKNDNEEKFISFFKKFEESLKSKAEQDWSRILREEELLRLLGESILEGSKYYQSDCSSQISLIEFSRLMTKTVKDWFMQFPEMRLDDEQASAVAECGPHVQVVARAGSGKTRTLVARALFQINHCRIPASSILILAFNKKAVEEIRERLSKYLSVEQMPHVLTFHALAYRIVRPKEELIYDEKDSKEAQAFSTTFQRIIDEEMRGGTLEPKLRELMKVRWHTDIERIIQQGFNLPPEKFLTHRANFARTTMNGRRVESEAHKHIGNALLRLGLGYSYRRGIHLYAGDSYAPDFSHYRKEVDQRFLIEVLNENAAETNTARQAFWRSDRSSNAHLIQLRAEECEDPDEILARVAKEFASRGLSVSPVSDDELWLLLRDDVIRDYTKAVKNFISRCQKELISPEKLSSMLPVTDPPLWTTLMVGERCVVVPHIPGVKVRFWRLCSQLYRRYLQVLTELGQTDFDQLMHNAAVLIYEGQTGFTSARGRGDICQIRHLLIDEFQDFSHLFEELRKSIVDQSPDAYFFCVGDDWQAINKFAGSDLRYFTGFGDIFKPSVRKLITRNYRSSRRIVEIGNRVMKDLGEPAIPNSKEEGKIYRAEVRAYSNLTEAEELVVEELGDDALAILRIASDCTSRGESLAILSRISSTATSEGMVTLEKWQNALQRFLPDKQRELLEVSTTHGFKGKEADVVILLDPEAYPFVHPDAIFATIFGDSFDSICDDEKRLFYVGVTRPKKRLYLLSYPSSYPNKLNYKIRFLKDSYPQAFDINSLQSNLLVSNRVVLRLTNQLGYSEGAGTIPLKDSLKKMGCKWNDETKTWTKFMDHGAISSPLECSKFLQRQPWLKSADGIIATFTWEDQRHRLLIDKGIVVTAGSTPQCESSDIVQTRNVDPSKSIDGSHKSHKPVDRELSAENPRSIERDRGMEPRNDQSVKQLIQTPPAIISGVLAGVFQTGVVGMKYEGRMKKAEHLKAGDFVRLQREPKNHYDRNAIQVITTDGIQIGYLSKQVATHLAPALDAWGGVSPAKISSIWKQEPPHFHVSIQICFPLPPGVVIPEELDISSQWDDNPFGTNAALSHERKSIEAPRSKITEVPKHTPADPAVGSFHQSIPDQQQPIHQIESHFVGLSQSQLAELENLLDPRLGPIIAEMYLTGCSDWPYIGYEGKDTNGQCTGSMLEVAWQDFKIGISMPENDYRSFELAGWVILPAATVTASELRNLFTTKADATKPNEKLPPTQPYEKEADTGKIVSEKEFTDTIIRIKNGAFYDDDPDDDIPF